jgi:hypothetical protein
MSALFTAALLWINGTTPQSHSIAIRSVALLITKRVEYQLLRDGGIVSNGGKLKPDFLQEKAGNP